MAKILLVEDDTFIAEIYAHALKKEGFETFFAVNGGQAIEQVAKVKPDLILLDILLPDFDGFEVLERVNKQKLETRMPIIMVSNLSDSESITKATDLGANDYMVKANVTPQDIVARVKQTLKIE